MGGSSYARSGVDLAKVRGLHTLLGEELGKTFQNRRRGFGVPLAEIGHYAGLIDLGDGKALSLHTDGVGTKVIVAQMMRKFDTVGIDCVAMTVNDLLCVGSEPVALLDYIALERENDSLVAELVRGLVVGAKRSSTTIVGGETAILKDVIKGIGGSGFDLATMGVGVVEKRAIIDGSSIAAGDRLIGIRSSGLHSNGFTLARHVLLRRHKLTDHLPELGTTLGEEMMVPTRIYVKPILESLRTCEIHGLAHLTGGAYSKLRRIVGTKDLSISLDKPPSAPIFELIGKEGRISREEMYKTFNMGVGFCVVSPSSEVDQIISICRRTRFEAFELGRVGIGKGVRVDGIRVA